MDGQARQRRFSAILSASILLLIPMVFALSTVNPPTVSYADDSYYYLCDPIVNEDFSKVSHAVVIDAKGTARCSWTDNGLLCSLDRPGDLVRVSVERAVDSLAVSLNIKDIVRFQSDVATAKFMFEGGPWAVEVLFGIGMYNTSLSYEVHGPSSAVHYADLFLDRPDNADLAVWLDHGIIVANINGVEDVQDLGVPSDIVPERAWFEAGAGETVNDLRTLTLFRLQAGLGSEVTYRDTLHKTILPDGMDMAFSLHIHADKAYIQHFEVMAQLSERYGLRGTYDAWWKGNAQQYGMESPEYVAALHILQNAGWDIGVHGGSISDMTREQVISALENMTADLGELRTWSDHGYRPQALAMEGADQSSEHYVKDLVIRIGAGWWHDNAHAHSRWNDLNREGMDYRLPGHEDLPLFRVSKQQALKLFYEQGRQMNTSSWIRAMPVDRSVFVAHDYFPFFLYVQNATGNYSVLPEHDGITNTPWNKLTVKRDYLNGTWHVLPRFEGLLSAMVDYDVWFATVRDIYDRSCLIQHVTMEETETDVRLINGNNREVSDMTIFTKGRPLYALTDGANIYQAEKGAGGSWHFVFDLAPHESLTLNKVCLVGPDGTSIEVTSPVLIASIKGRGLGA